MDVNVNKAKKIRMIEEIKSELLYYFRNGYLNLKFFFEFDDVRFANFKDILKIHFIISKEANDFTRTLEKYLSEFKHSTTLNKDIYINEIRGKVDWNRTFKTRMNTGNHSSNIFVSDNVDKLYVTKENIILKKSIEILYNIIYKEIGMSRFEDYEWYSNGKKISRIVSTLYNSNIYIKRIDISKIKITDKMINDVTKSRNKLYRDAAKIVKFYKALMENNLNYINELLSYTYIEMKNENEVFELYSIIKYIRNNYVDQNVEFNIIDGNENYLASIDAGFDSKIIIYHNRSASKYLDFKVTVNDIQGENEYLKNLRRINSQTNRFKTMQNMNTSNLIWSGRPDLIILKLSGDVLEEITIGEIKYTKDINYTMIGFEELCEYLTFVKPIHQSESSYRLNGILFVEDVPLIESYIDNITVINSSNF